MSRSIVESAIAADCFCRMNIIVRIITGVIQDNDNNLYDRVTIVYVVLAGISVVSSLSLTLVSWRCIDLGQLQWSRKLRIARGDTLTQRKVKFYGENGAKNKNISMICFGSLILLILGSWCGYFYGVATGQND